MGESRKIMSRTRTHRPSAPRPAPPASSQACPRRLAVLAGGSLAVAAAVLIIPYGVGIGDTWMLALSGRYFLAQGVHTVADPFSYATTHLYVEHEWLPAILFALRWAWGGWPALLALFQEPFATRWLLDVELLARWLQARRGTALPPVAHVIYEYVLDAWREVSGSHVTLRDCMTSVAQLAWIGWHYRC